MKDKTLLTIVYDFISGEGKIKFIEELNYFNKINSHSQKKILLDLSNFCSGKDFQFDQDFRELDLYYFRPCNFLELYKFSKKRDIYAFGLDNCSFRLLKIFLLLKLLKFKLIFVNRFGFFPQSYQDKKFIKSKNFFIYKKNKINYLFFRILSLLRIIPVIKYYFEASQSRIDTINNSISNNLDKQLNFKLFSYFENIVRINSVYYDGFLTRKENAQKDDFILFIDNGFDHPDRINNDSKILIQERDNYYKNLFYFLLKIKKIYNLEIYYCKHPKSNYPKNEYFAQIEKEFFFPQSSTIDLISSSRFVIFSETTLINQIILKKKKIILLNSKFLGNYYSSKVNSIKNEIDLFYLSLENLDLITKDKLEYEMKKKIMLYDEFISKNIISEKNIFSFEQIKKFLLIE